MLVVASVAGLAIASYLSITKLTSGAAVCLPGGGCETVALSEYSSIFGIPVAYLGFVFSLVLLGGLAVWLRRRDRRVLYALYALSLFGVVFVAYLTYLELFVIHAVCTWCALYAVTVVVTFAAVALEMRRTPR